MARMKCNRDADPQRLEGRWVMAHNHVLFRVEEAWSDGKEVRYSGTGLHNQRVTTGFPVAILREEDECWINQQHGAKP